jgi:hypothetical protein
MKTINVTTEAGFPADNDKLRVQKAQEELAGQEAIAAITRDTIVALKRLCEIPNISENLKILCCKYIDGYTRATEKVRDNLVEAGKVCAAQLKAAERANDDTEINSEEYWMLTRRRLGLIEQYRFADIFFKAHMDARAEIVSTMDVNWSSYRTMKEMTQQKEHTRRMKQATIAADRLIGLTEAKYREFLRAMGSYKTGSDAERVRFHNNWLKEQERYKPSADGIDADDNAGSGPTNVADFEKEKSERELNTRIDEARLDELDPIERAEANREYYRDLRREQ